MPQVSPTLGDPASAGRPVAYTYACIPAAARGAEPRRRMSTPAEIADYFGGRPRKVAPGVIRINFLRLWNRTPGPRSKLRVEPWMGRDR